MRRNGARIHDPDVRRRAATDFETNLVIEAGAGTGKTSLLVERALNAVGGGVAPIDRIAAITFTEKAAGEMRVRIAAGLDRLRHLACGGPDRGATEADRAFEHLVERAGRSREEIARSALEAMEQMDRATIATIHGFCAELLRAHPVEARVDPDFVVDDGQQAERVRAEEWETFALEELGAGATRAELWRALLGDLPIAEIEELAFKLADFSIPERLLHPPFALPDARELFDADIARLIVGIGALLAENPGFPDVPQLYFSRMLRALEALRASGLDAFRRAVDEQGDLRARVLGDSAPPSPPKRLDSVVKARFVALQKDSRSLARGLLEANDALLLRAVEAVAPFALRCRESYLRRGFVSFNALLVLTRDLLRDHPAVRRRLKERYRLLLVDEFQDTDPVQYEIVLLLAEAAGEEAAEPYAARLASGKLFIVGDAKQSVYRFRGADYAAYRRAVQRIAEAGGARLDLTTNFRSVPGLLGPVNEVFTHAASRWVESDHQPRYVPIVPARSQDDRTPRVEVWTVELPAGALAEERREAEGRAIAAEIERLVEDGHCKYQQITILFRAFTSIASYLRALRERAIPFVVDGGRDFLRRPEVGQMIATLQCLAQPADPPALLAFLRSPAGAVSDKDLAAYAGGGGRFSWQQEVDAERFPAIARAFGLLQAIARDARELPADAVVRMVLRRTLALPLGAAAFEGPQRVANLLKISAAAGELAREGRLSLEEIAEALREGRRADIETDRPLADDAAEAVRITSIHRMKGLENDRIFLPDLARQEPSGSNRIREASAAVVHLPGGRSALALGTKSAASATRVARDRDDEHHRDSEETRVFYVALTRARESLVVLAGAPRGSAPWIAALEPWGYRASDPPADGAPMAGGAVLHRRPTAKRHRRPEAAALDEGEIAAAVARHDEAIARARALARPLVETPSGLVGEPERERPAIAAGRSRDLALAVGRVVHRLLEVAATDTPDALLAKLRALCREAADEDGVGLAPLECEAKQIVDAFLASPLAPRLRAAKAVGRELPLLLRREDGRVFHGSIDLLYETAPGEMVVADFKTDRETDDDALRDAYRDQLSVYADAVRAALALDSRPRAELWLLRAGRSIDVPL